MINVESIFSTLREYLRDSLWGARSILSACATSVPYLFSKGEYRKEVTEQYPDPVSSRTSDDLPPRTRGLLTNDIIKCIGCKECEVVCPTQAIRVETEPGSDANNIWVSIFDIDFSKCVFCALCVDVCAPQSLVHSKEFELATERPAKMIRKFGRGSVTQRQREIWASLRRQAAEDEGAVR